MSITFNGTDHEKNSPFCIRNKEFCENWQEQIIKIGGNFKSTYNAQSFNIKAKLELEQPWIFEIKKSTYASDNLLFSPEEQTISKWSTLKTKIKLNSPSFKIKKNAFWDFLKLTKGRTIPKKSSFSKIFYHF